MTLENSRWMLCVRVVTVVFAAIPATGLGLLAGFGFVFGIFSFFSSPIAGLLMVIWGGGGLVGVVALWAIVFNHYKRWVASGLLTGIVCVSPFAVQYLNELLRYLFFSGLSDTGSDVWVHYLFILLLITLPAIAIAWVIFLVRHLPTIDEPESELIEVRP